MDRVIIIENDEDEIPPLKRFKKSKQNTCISRDSQKCLTLKRKNGCIKSTLESIPISSKIENKLLDVNIFPASINHSNSNAENFPCSNHEESESAISNKEQQNENLHHNSIKLVSESLSSPSQHVELHMRAEKCHDKNTDEIQVKSEDNISSYPSGSTVDNKSDQPLLACKKIGNEFGNNEKKKLKQSRIMNFFKGSPDKPGNKKILMQQTTPLRSMDKIKRNFKTTEKFEKKEKITRQCPFYKKIPDTSITVDAFRYGDIPGCTCYFLTHFHSDHYGGLSKKFQGVLYCSEVTGNLVISELRIDKSRVIKLPMNRPVSINNVKVILLDANHCPGSVMFYFVLANGRRILHVGDFRADMKMFSLCDNLLQNNPVDQLYLDTTYCDHKYKFPPQNESINFVRRKVRTILTTCPATLICVGSYTIGKERVFTAIADELDIKRIAVSKNKLKVLTCLQDKELDEKLTVDNEQTNLHVVPMMWLNYQKLNDYLKLHNKSGKYEQLVAFKPTGWTYSSNMKSLDDIKPMSKGAITIYGIPYSEHSSYTELEMFVKTIKPKKIIPTVNIGSKISRDKMNAIFKIWLK